MARKRIPLPAPRGTGDAWDEIPARLEAALLRELADGAALIDPREEPWRELATRYPRRGWLEALTADMQGELDSGEMRDVVPRVVSEIVWQLLGHASNTNITGTVGEHMATAVAARRRVPEGSDRDASAWIRAIYSAFVERHGWTERRVDDAHRQRRARRSKKDRGRV